MADRETVIKCLEACTGVTDDCAGHTCPYWDFDDSVVDWGCRIQMEKDALEVLKEQEADIIAMSRFLESHGWDSDSICGKNVEIVVTNGDEDDA